MEKPHNQQYILVIGATSCIAKAVVKEYAKAGYNFHFMGRNLAETETFAKQIEVDFNCHTQAHLLDVLEIETHAAIFEKLWPIPYAVIVAAGYLGNHKLAEYNSLEAQTILQTNFNGCASVLLLAANILEKNGCGFIIAISSLAGDRGRKNNYLYGSAKAGLNTFLSGLRHRLFSKKIQVLTVKPGYVYTKMTQHLNFPKKLTVYPQHIAKDIFRAQQKGKHVIYTPWFWKYIMLVIKALPQWLFLRSKL